MIYTLFIQKAIRFAIKTHEFDQKQKRKGKDIPYITHPLSVGLILAMAGATEDVIVAGILHDTLEDSIEENRVTKKIITDMFGQSVSDLVLSVTEQDKSLSWVERKAEALEHIKTFSHDSLLLKSADIIDNTRELISDYEIVGEETFKRFNAPKEKLLQNYAKTIIAIVDKWTGNPLVDDLNILLEKIKVIQNN
jgi:(p)ppGpp synthase/HD superfamily hydrolase